MCTYCFLIFLFISIYLNIYIYVREYAFFLRQRKPVVLLLINFPRLPFGSACALPRYILEWQNLRLLVFVWPALLGAGLIAIEILSQQLVDSSAEPTLMQKHLLRKSFHLLAICLFGPSLFLLGQPGVEFLALAQLVAALLFIALEVCRASRAPLCHIQDRFLSKYLDKREDAGEEGSW